MVLPTLTELIKQATENGDEDQVITLRVIEDEIDDVRSEIPDISLHDLEEAVQGLDCDVTAHDGELASLRSRVAELEDKLDKLC